MRSHYVGIDVHSLFPNGIDFSNPRHFCFRNVQIEPDPFTGDELEFFDSLVEGTFDDGSGPQPVTLTGPVAIVVRGKGPSATGTFATEIVAMDLSGDVGGIPVQIRESPFLPSPGQTSITPTGDGRFIVDSFFDVVSEISVAGGPFEPQLNGHSRMELKRVVLPNPNPPTAELGGSAPIP